MRLSRLAFVSSLVFLPLFTPNPALAQESKPNPALAPEPKPEPIGLVREPHLLLRGIDFVSRTAGDGTDRKNGVRLVFSTGLTGAGWISGGAGFRQWVLKDHAVFDTSAAISWRSYGVARARFEFTRLAHGRLAAGVQAEWQDLKQITYFGEGPDTPTADRSEYRLTSRDVVGYATVRPAEWVAINGGIGWLARPALKAPGGSFERGNPPVPEVFPNDPAFSLARQPNFLHDEVSITADTRDFRSHAAEGGVYHAGLRTFHDRDTGLLTTHRFEAEAAHFVSLHPRVVLAMHAALATSGTAEGHVVPLYLLPSLGGHTSLRGYIDHRFHDRNALVVNIEPRFALMTHVDAAVFFDAGNVSARARDLNLDKTSYGFALSMHSRRATFARLDVAHGAGGWLIGVRMSDPFHLAKMRNQTVIVPFAR